MRHFDCSGLAGPHPRELGLSSAQTRAGFDEALAKSNAPASAEATAGRRSFSEGWPLAQARPSFGSLLWWTFLALFVASTVSAQSLAEIAKKEKARRKKVESSASHSYTERDLKNPYGPMTQVSGQSSAATSGDESTQTAEGATGESSAGDSGNAEQEDPKKTEAYWRDRLSTVDKRIQDLEAKLNSPAMTSNPRGAPARQATEQQLAQARADRQAIVNEARAAGAPPGWLR